MLVRRALRTIAALALALIGVLVPTAAQAVTPSATAPVAQASAPRGVDDFSYSSWDARYDLSLDRDGRSRLHVVETLVAAFPDIDQNRGIVRGLATTYQNASLHTRVLSVTDGQGNDVPYDTETDDGVLYVLTGDHRYVHGPTTYAIEYEMRDVILAADNGVDEFYWDLLPLDSTQPIDAFRAEISLSPALAQHLTGNSRCYSGFEGATTECPITGPAEHDGSVLFEVSSGPREAGSGVTVAIGLEPGTATQPATRLPNAATDVVPGFAALGALLTTIAGSIAVGVFSRRRRRATGVIIAQFDVPDDMPPLLAATIIPRAENDIPAEIVHLAVRGALRIEEGVSKKRPRLRRTADGAAPDALDVAAMDALFRDDDVATLPKADEAFANRMRVLQGTARTEAQHRGLTTRERSGIAVTLQLISLGLITIGAILSIGGVISGRLTAIPALVILAILGMFVLFLGIRPLRKHTVLTPAGAVQLEYLQGVREFIRVAEADRLRMLQSYAGAERRADGDIDVIVLYERLLPYAMLFGLEKQWGKVLENAYSAAQRGPAWMADSSSAAFRTNLIAFTSTSNSASSYTAPSVASSSSGGGSSGGGFSGGGGGGGFSGGR